MFRFRLKTYRHLSVLPTMDPHLEKVQQALSLTNKMIQNLRTDQRLAVHNRIDQFHYMTKSEELNFLITQYKNQKALLDHTTLLMAQKHDEIIQQYAADSELIARL